nr:M28 family metallopeptidase [Pseudoxanthomonas sp.]
MTSRTSRRPLWAGLLLLIALPSLAADGGGVVSWKDQVARISAGADTGARGQAITGRLDALGLAWRGEDFEQKEKQGRNLLVDLGGPEGAPLLLIGAHYDRVAVGHGATDNASGSAAVLELAERLKARPLSHHRVQIAFWDLEEAGLLGSHAYVTTPGREKPALYVNFDVFGWGDTLWMMSPQADTPLVGALRKGSETRGLGFQPGEHYPPTDHLAFLKQEWPAVSFSLVGGGEIDPILAVFSGKSPENPPKVMQVIHSPRDTVAELDDGRVDDALDVIEQGLRDWDAGAR